MTTGRSLTSNEVPVLRCPSWIDINALLRVIESRTDFRSPAWTPSMIRGYWASLATLILVISIERETDHEVQPIREELLTLGVLNHANNGMFYTAVADVRECIETAETLRAHLSLVL